MTKSRLYFQRKLRVVQLKIPHPSPVTILKFTIISWAKGLEDFLKRYSGFDLTKKIDLILSCNLNSKYNS